MIVNHNDIILEIRFLRQRTFYGILDGLLAVKDWNNDGGLHLEFLLIEIDILILTGINQRPYLTKMGCTGLLHLYLHLTIGRIHIVELLDA